jgi:hypothetical protein
MRRLLTISLLGLFAFPCVAGAAPVAVNVSSIQPQITNLHSTTSNVSGGETEMAAWSQGTATGIAWRRLGGVWTAPRTLPGTGLVDIGDYSTDAFVAVFQNATKVGAMNGSRKFDGGFNTIGHDAPGTKPVLAVDPDLGSAIAAWIAPAAHGRRVVQAAIRRSNHLFSKPQTITPAGHVTAIAVGNSSSGAAVAYVLNGRLYIRIRAAQRWRAPVLLGAAGGATSSDIQVGFDDTSDRSTVVAWRHGGILDVAGAAPFSRPFARHRLETAGAGAPALAGSDNEVEWELAYPVRTAAGTVVRQVGLGPAPGKARTVSSPGPIAGLSVRRSPYGDVMGWVVPGSSGQAFVGSADISPSPVAVAPGANVTALQPLLAGSSPNIGAVWIEHSAAGDVVRAADALATLPVE